MWRRLICKMVLFANAFLVFRVRYHAARGLIYLGCMDVGGVYLFKRVPGKVVEFAFLPLCLAIVHDF